MKHMKNRWVHSLHTYEKYSSFKNLNENYTKMLTASLDYLIAKEFEFQITFVIQNANIERMSIKFQLQGFQSTKSSELGEFLEPKDH